MRHINLLDERPPGVEPRPHLRKALLCALVAAPVLILCWVAVARCQVAALDREIVELESELLPLRERHQHLERECEHLAAESSTIEALREPVSSAAVLALLTQLMPDDVALIELVLENPSLEATGTGDESADGRVPALRIQLQGATPAVSAIARLVNSLTESGHFQHVRLDQSRERDQDERRIHDFRVTMEMPVRVATAMARSEP